MAQSWLWDSQIVVKKKSGKQDCLGHILKSSANIYERLASQFFGTTTGIQAGLHPLDKSRFVVTLLTILGVIEILCSFRLALEGKKGKEIPKSSKLEFLEKFLANNFALSEAEDNTSRPLERGGIVFMCNAKSFAIDIILFPLFSTTNLDGLTKVACQIFHIS